MNAKISVFDNCVKVIIYLLLYNLHDYTFNKNEAESKMENPINVFKEASLVF